MEKNYSPREAAAILGVAVHTIQVWDREGRIRCVRLPSGRRRIPESEVRRLLNIKEERKDAIYARVFSGDERRDLDRQVASLRKLAPSAVVYTDMRSGVNFRRNGLFQLLEDVTEKRIARLYVTFEDRLARIGFELISWLCEKYGTEIVAVNEKEFVSSQEERARDLIAVNMAFASKLYGLRSRRTKRLLQSVKAILAESETA
jgi:putative resolvase